MKEVKLERSTTGVPAAPRVKASSSVVKPTEAADAYHPQGANPRPSTTPVAPSVRPPTPGETVKSAQVVLLVRDDAFNEKPIKLNPRQSLTLVVDNYFRHDRAWSFAGNPAQPKVKMISEHEMRDKKSGLPMVGSLKQTWEVSWTAKQLATCGKGPFELVATYAGSSLLFKVEIDPDAP